jgi:Tn3 transposase DDE domain
VTSDDYLIPPTTWVAERQQHYAALGLPIDSDTYLEQLEEQLHVLTAGVDARVLTNPALTIDSDKGDYHLARLKASPAQDAAKGLIDLLQSRMPEVELIDALIDIDNETDFLHYCLQSGEGRRLPPAVQRRNALAALVAVGCNIGPTRIAAASGLSVWEISQAVDWWTDDSLKDLQHRPGQFRYASADELHLWPRRHLFGRWHALLRAGRHPGR